MTGGSADQAPARPAVATWARRLRGTSFTTKIVCGAAAAALAIALVSLAVSGGPATARALPAARNFTLRALADPGQKIALAGYAACR